MVHPARSLPIGAARSTDSFARREGEGQRTKLNRRGRHRGIFWAPPCPACHRGGGFRTTHTDDDKNYPILPCFPVKSELNTILATIPGASSVPTLEPASLEIVSEPWHCIPPLSSDISTTDDHKVGSISCFGDVAASAIMQAVRTTNDDIVHVTQAFMHLHQALEQIPDDDMNTPLVPSKLAFVDIEDNHTEEQLDTTVPQVPLRDSIAVILGQVAFLQEVIQKEYTDLAYVTDFTSHELSQMVRRFEASVYASPLKDFLTDFYCLTVIDAEYQNEHGVNAYAGANLTFSEGLMGPLRHLYEHVLMPEYLCACGSNYGIGVSSLYEDPPVSEAAVEIFLLKWHTELYTTSR